MTDRQGQLFLVYLFVLCTCSSGFLPGLGSRLSSTLSSSSTSFTDDAIKSENTPFSILLADLLIGSMFRIKPLKSYITSKARSDMMDRGLRIDVDWKRDIEYLDNNMDTLLKNYESIIQPNMEYPEYYKKPFHAYEEGNLSWQAAKEVECAALTVHAPIYTPSRDILRRDGDATLRDNFHKNMIQILNVQKDNGFITLGSIKRVVDIGCSTGLSTVKLLESFPHAEVIGVDLSPQMLSVAKFQLDMREEMRAARSSITYRQAAGESMDLGDEDVDLVSMCLISHELPTQAAKRIFDEAYRMLKPGGCLSLMDMDPLSPFFQKFASNPIAFTAFKSTEPWIQEYVTMDLEKTLMSCGFLNIQTKPNSPRHRTVIAYKAY